MTIVLDYKVNLWSDDDMGQIAVSKLKATCLAVVEEVRKTRKPILITKFGEPIAQIVPLPAAELPKHWLGSFVGSGTIVGDIVGSSTDESEWSALQD